jgi:hypothetical protein
VPEQDLSSYSFDLSGLAKAVPGILLKTALEAERQFAAADTNRNGVSAASKGHLTECWCECASVCGVWGGDALPPYA